MTPFSQELDAYLMQVLGSKVCFFLLLSCISSVMATKSVLAKHLVLNVILPTLSLNGLIANPLSQISRQSMVTVEHCQLLL